MTRELFAEGVLDQFRANLSRHNAGPRKTLRHDRWVCASLLQKAIRRGETGWALKAASTLLVSDASWLWKRLATIAFEDVSFGDVDLVAELLACRGHERAKQSLSDWRTASYFVTKLSQAAKCRAPSNLAYLVHNGLEGIGCESEPRDLAAAVHDADATSTERIRAAVALLRMSTAARQDQGDGYSALNFARSPLADYCYWRGKRLAPLDHVLALAVLWPLFEGAQKSPLNDEVKEDGRLVCGIPDYAFDMYTRAGCRAIRALCARVPALRAILVRASVPTGDWLSVLSHFLFDLESGLLRRRLCHSIDRELHVIASAAIPGGYALPVDAFYSVLRENLPLLRQTRAAILT